MSGHASANPLTTLRLQLFGNAYEPLPVAGPDMPVKSPGKQPVIPGWQAMPINSEAIDSWSTGSQQRCINTGLRCGLLVGIDIDVLEPILAAKLKQLASMVFGPTPLRRIGKAPKELYCYRFLEPQPKQATSRYLMPDGTEALVEVLAKGQQFVAYGVHPDTRQEYHWPDKGPDVVPLHDLPVIAPEAVQAFLASATTLILQAGGKPKKDEGKQAREEREAPRDEHASASSRPGFGARGGDDFFRNVNARALQDIGCWMRAIFGNKAREQAGTGAWRVSSADLGRGLEEDLSVHPDHGGRDFGPEKSCSPIDIVIEHGGAADAKDAALWLCEQLRVRPEDLGWSGGQKGQRTRQADPLRYERGKMPPPPPEDWPEPVDFLADDEMNCAPLLAHRHIPEAIWGFVTDTSERMGVDPAAVALAALTTCAAAATDDWKLQPKRLDDTWTENPRIWCAIVGDPSVLKTPVISACTRPLEDLEMEARKEHAEKDKAYKIALNVWKKESKDNPALEPPIKPKMRRYIVEGTTIEALTEALRDDPESKYQAAAKKVLSRQDEMSEWLGSMDRYRNGGSGSSDRGSYLRLFNGGRSIIDRVMRGTFAIPSWSACFIGGIQPSVIQKIATNGEEDGLLQRFCYCVAGQNFSGVDRRPDHAALQRYRGTINALTALTPNLDLEHMKPRPVVFHEDAHPFRERIERLRKVMAGMPDVTPRLKSAYGKWSGLFPRVALTFHLIEIADLRARQQQTPHHHVLRRETAERAAVYLEEILLPHLLRADAQMFETRQGGHAKWIGGYILAHGLKRVTARDIMRSYHDLRAPETRSILNQVMESLVAIGWLRAEEPPSTAKSPTAWEVNPLVLERFALRGEVERTRRAKAQEEMRRMIMERQQEKEAG